MGTEKKTKINQLLSSHPSGIVLLSKWLSSQGYNLNLQKRYRNGNWLVSIGTGAMIRSGDKVGYEGAIYALQEQSNLQIHLGGRTALSMLGKAHYLELSATMVTLFGSGDEKLPAWFLKHDWGVKINYHSTSFLPSSIGLSNMELKTFTIKIASAARAIMECLFLTPKNQDLLECYQLMEGLNNLRPKLVQKLLEQCTSIKVKRLFLYLAEKARHNWIEYLDLEKIDLGSGKRSIVKNGIYIPKYQITVPKALDTHGKF